MHPPRSLRGQRSRAYLISSMDSKAVRTKVPSTDSPSIVHSSQVIRNTCTMHVHVQCMPIQIHGSWCHKKIGTPIFRHPRSANPRIYGTPISIFLGLRDPTRDLPPENWNSRERTTVPECMLSRNAKTVADLGGVRGVQMHPPLAASNVFLYITARVHRMIMQQWNASATTRHSYTLTYQFLTDLQTFD